MPCCEGVYNAERGMLKCMGTVDPKPAYIITLGLLELEVELDSKMWW